MTDKHTENSVRLLDIIYDLYAGEGGCLSTSLPFTVDEKGVVTLDGGLVGELNRDGNKDLVDWAYKNIVSLFE